MAGSTSRAQGRTGLVRPGGSVAALLLAVVATVSGCAGEPEFEWPEDPVAESTPTVDAAEADAVGEILARFDDFRRAEIAAQADPVPAYEAQDQLSEFLGDPLLAEILFEVEILHQRGLVREGEPSWQASVTELRLDDDPPTATVQDCLDTTDWRLAHRATGEPADPAGLPVRFAPERHPVEFTVTFVDERWLFDGARTEGDGAC